MKHIDKFEKLMRNPYYLSKAIVFARNLDLSYSCPRESIVDTVRRNKDFKGVLILIPFIIHYPEFLEDIRDTIGNKLPSNTGRKLKLIFRRLTDFIIDDRNFYESIRIFEKAYNTKLLN